MEELFKTQKDVNQFNLWIDTLYAEKYKKGKGILQQPNGGYCCLGVGCILTIPKTKLKKYNRTSTLIGSYPRHQKHAPLWLTDINTIFHKKTGMNLSYLNDMGVDIHIIEDRKLIHLKLPEFTHPEIAMLLELVFIYKILD